MQDDASLCKYILHTLAAVQAAGLCDLARIAKMAKLGGTIAGPLERKRQCWVSSGKRWDLMCVLGG